jgi:hypothetical protein
MKTWVPLLLGCLLVATSHAQTRREVYQWKDADGVTHFSDQPQPGARKIVLNGAPPASTTTPAAVSPSRPTAAAAAPQAQYDALEIWSPDDEASFFEPDTEIVVRVRPQPSLDEADRLVTYLDGKVLPELNALEHRLTGLPRGAHTVQSAIFGRDGQEKIRSPRITFHMKQPTVANPRNQGPAVRPPPPRPTPRPTPR